MSLKTKWPIKQWIQTNTIFSALLSFRLIWKLRFPFLWKSKSIFAMWSPSSMNMLPTISALITFRMVDMNHEPNAILRAAKANPDYFIPTTYTLLADDVSLKCSSFLIRKMKFGFLRCTNQYRIWSSSNILQTLLFKKTIVTYDRSLNMMPCYFFCSKPLIIHRLFQSATFSKSICRYWYCHCDKLFP